MTMKLPNFKHPPQLLRVTFHINTPMFAAGANQMETELTPTTFKGVLRFWWRALNWSKIYLEKNKNKADALKELHQQEARLFGIAGSDHKGGQGECLVNTLALDKPRKWSLPDNKNGVKYLLGQGIYNFKKGQLREAIADKQTFSIDLTITANAYQSVIDALNVMGLLGGFGSRSRHGFGSVTLVQLQKKTLGGDYEDIPFEQDPKKALTQILKDYRCRENNDLPPLSAFYQGTRIDIVGGSQTDAVHLLDKAGEEMQLYRSYGSKNKDNIYEVNGKNPERNFIDDHDLILHFIDNKIKQNNHPRRVIFGLPHNYRYSSGAKLNVNAVIGRRASPLFQHIHQLKNKQYCLIHCLLKCEFLPANEKIMIGREKVNPSPDWQVIETFMNRFKNKDTI